MARCKYPEEVCSNMTILNGEAYCDSIPCSLRDEISKQTNADKIRSMSDEELAELLSDIDDVNEGYLFKESYLAWLQSEAE